MVNEVSGHRLYPRSALRANNGLQLSALFGVE